MYYLFVKCFNSFWLNWLFMSNLRGCNLYLSKIWITSVWFIPLSLFKEFYRFMQGWLCNVMYIFLISAQTKANVVFKDNLMIYVMKEEKIRHISIPLNSFLLFNIFFPSSTIYTREFTNWTRGFNMHVRQTMECTKYFLSISVNLHKVNYANKHYCYQ